MKFFKLLLSILASVIVISTTAYADEVDPYNQSVFRFAIQYEEDGTPEVVTATTFYVGDGFFITSAHQFDMVGLSGKMYVGIQKGKDTLYYPLTLIVLSSSRDFAVLKTNDVRVTSYAKALHMNTNLKCSRGDKLYTVGFPGNSNMVYEEVTYKELGFKVSMDSQKTRILENAIVTELIGERGQSGSPLLDSSGSVVGIMSVSSDIWSCTWFENIDCAEEAVRKVEGND